MSKKIWAAFLSSFMIIAILMLAGCSSSTPSGVIDNVLKDIKSSHSLTAYLPENTNSIGTNSNNNIRDDVMKKFADKVYSFDYEIISETIEDDKATVEVKISTYNVGKCISNTIANNFVTLLARLISPLMTELAITYLSLVGSILIFCVGVNLVWGKKIRVANMLPAVILAVVAAYLPFQW